MEENNDHRTKLLSEAYGLVRLALPLMAKYQIPATPSNYAVWYHYVSGSSHDLTKTIDAMREKGEAFTEQNNEDLYRQFFGGKDENELIKIREDLQQILVTMVREVADLTGQTAEYESFLAGTVNMLSKTAPLSDIKMVIVEIIDKTRTLGGFGKTLRRRLTETTETLETLKKEFDDVRTEALVDFLTGVPNRKAFHEAITGLTIEAFSEHRDLSLLLIDIDHFKQFNDQHGHLVGDEVLRFVAKKIKEIVRGRDFLGRFGGEEFALILPETPIKGAAVVAESIRSFFAQTTLEQVTTAKKLGKITLSIGVACYRPGESTEELIKRADQALYSAKKGGRNRVQRECEDSQKLPQQGWPFSGKLITTP